MNMRKKVRHHNIVDMLLSSIHTLNQFEKTVTPMKQQVVSCETLAGWSSPVKVARSPPFDFGPLMKQIHQSRWSGLGITRIVRCHF